MKLKHRKAPKNTDKKQSQPDPASREITLLAANQKK